MNETRLSSIRPCMCVVSTHPSMGCVSHETRRSSILPSMHVCCQLLLSIHGLCATIRCSSIHSSTHLCVLASSFSIHGVYAMKIDARPSLRPCMCVARFFYLSIDRTRFSSIHPSMCVGIFFIYPRGVCYYTRCSSIHPLMYSGILFYLSMGGVCHRN
jgi:hypothetical protein